MNKDLILEKQSQAIEILKEKNIDMWLTFVRETGNIKDPMLDMLVGTGATWHSAFILTSSGDTIAVIGSLEEANMKSVGTFKEIRSYLKSVKDDLRNVLKEYNPNKIAVNYSRNSTLADGLTHGMYLELLGFIEGTGFEDKLVSSEDIVAELRGRKAASELNNMKEAIKETLAIFDQVTGYLKPGVSEKDVADFVRSIVHEKGYEFSWDEEHCPAVFTGPDTAGAHAGPTERKVQRGHVVNMDFGVKINGYCADLQRTWYILKEGEDKAPESVMKGFNVIVESITKAADAIKPGKQATEIDAVARGYIEENGYEGYPHGLGHQVGRAAHDGGALLAPEWERYGNLPYMKLEKGQVFTIEPRLTIDGYGIATIEEEIVITEDGCEWLSPRQTKIYLVK